MHMNVTLWADATPDDARDRLAGILAEADGPDGLARPSGKAPPFRLLEVLPGTLQVDEASGDKFGTAMWACDALDKATGRCSIYADRPNLCREYQPLSDGLCALFEGTENGEESAWPPIPGTEGRNDNEHP